MNTYNKLLTAAVNIGIFIAIVVITAHVFALCV